MDYGHTVEYGAFITPNSSGPKETVDLARLADRVGFGLSFSFQGVRMIQLSAVDSCCRAKSVPIPKTSIRPGAIDTADGSVFM